MVEYVYDDRSFKERTKEKLAKAKQSVADGLTWMATHPIETVTAISIGVGVVAEGRRVATGIARVHEKHVNDMTIYCNDVQTKVRLKHKLNYKECLELRDRMNNGQTKFEALDDMQLLK